MPATVGGDSREEYLTHSERRYGDFFAFAGKSAVLGRIWGQVFGDDYPEELEPFGFVTLSDLQAIKGELRVGRGDLLLDVGCGKGGPGLWVAGQLGARLLGIDILEIAIEQARRFAARFELACPCRFDTGSFIRTELPDASVQGIMSVDSFWMVNDQDAALDEMRRILQPRSRFVFTSWAPISSDLPTLLASHGFAVLRYEETPRWLERQLAVYDQMLASQEELRQEIGPAAAAVLISEAESVPIVLEDTPRVLIVAERS